MKTLLLRGLVLATMVFGLTVFPNSGPAHAAGLCYVNASAGGANTGSSWTDAYTSLTSATTNVGCTQIWVATGVYYPSSTMDPTASFIIAPGVAVYGGFAGGETMVSQRNATAHPTILSGDIDGNDTNIDGNFIDESYTEIKGTNSYHVVYMSGGTADVTSSTVLDSVIITGGSATGGSFSLQTGGGLWCNDGKAGGVCSPALSNIAFYGNQAYYGGGIYNYGEGGTSSPTITNATFQGNNSSFGGGGGMSNDGYGSGVSSPRLTNVTFYLNSASDGGGMDSDGHNHGIASPVLINVSFIENSAQNAGAMIGDGSDFGTYSPTLDGVTFYANDGGTYAGAMYNYGYGGVSTPTIGNSILWGDLATTAGPEIYNYGSTPTFINSDVAGSGGSGGGWDTTLGSDGGGNIDSNPELEGPKNNGGFVTTMALMWNSPAIDAGLDFVCPGPGFDARGIKRPQGPHCDMGAYERIPARASLGSGYQTDVAVFRPSTGGWFVKGLLATTFGLSGDDPLPYDFNGDGKSDVAVFRPSNASWYVQGQFSTFYGVAGDVPVPGDYDGNRTADVAVYRPSTSAWYVKNQFSTIFGLPGDIPVPGDYNGDGTTDVAVFRPSTGAWYVKGQFSAIFGLPGDIPVPADYNGDGITDLAVYRPSTHAWYVKGQFSTVYGTSGDIPVPGDYVGGGTADVAVYRPSTSGWFVQGITSTIYGLVGDYPLPAPDTNADGDPYQ